MYFCLRCDSRIIKNTEFLKCKNKKCDRPILCFRCYHLILEDLQKYRLGIYNCPRCSCRIIKIKNKIEKIKNI